MQEENDDDDDDDDDEVFSPPSLCVCTTDLCKLLFLLFIDEKNVIFVFHRTKKVTKLTLPHTIQ